MMEAVESDTDENFEKENSSNVEEEFRSCCEDEEWQDPKESLVDVDDEVSSNEDIDEFSLRMFFKGVSISENGDLGSKASGIGVVMESSNGVSILRVQKKLDIFVDDLVAEHLALLDGLIEAQRNGVERIVAFTDSEEVYHQIAEAEPHKDQLLVALGYRILELANKLEFFVLKLVCIYELERPLKLAQEAIGIVDEVTIDEIYCPFPNCSTLFSPSQCSSSRASSSNFSNINCVECQECCRLLCTRCVVPWHSSMSCEEYQSLREEESDVGDVTLCHLAQNNNWRQCQQCTRMIELTQVCYQVTCWCGHEFCYSCGTEYHDGTQNCQCTFYNNDEDNSESSTPSNQEVEQWRWEPFSTLSSITDDYSEQEQAQLALIQRFLSGGFGLNDDHHGINTSQSSPRCSNSYLDTLKDLNQLPWLERFVSVISDSYHEDYIQ